MSSTMETSAAAAAATNTAASSERVCYVHCTFCNTVLAVSVPCSSMYTVVTVRCGHCANLLSVNMGAAFHQAMLPHQHYHHQQDLQKQHLTYEDSVNKDHGSSSSSICNKFTVDESPDQPPQFGKLPPIPPPEKRQRIPSAYNRFIKEEIQRIKATNPDISHREAFSTAAKNWAHFPHIHFGLKMDGDNRPKMEETLAADVEAQATPKPQGFY